MRVLIYTTKSQDNDMKQHFASVLAHNLDKYIGVSIHTSLSSLRENLTSGEPHIIHILGCNSINIYRAVSMAMNHFIPVVLSPLGDLLHWNETTIQQATYRHFIKAVIHHVDAIHTCSVMEARRIETLAWNLRQETIQNCIVSNQISMQQMASAMIRLYNKVIDSNTFRLMTEEEKRAENILLYHGLSLSTSKLQSSHNAENNSLHHGQDLQGPPPSALLTLTPDSWRKILLHANDEHILDTVTAGASYLRLQIADVKIEHVDRFAQKLLKPNTLLPTDQLLAKHAIKMRTVFDHLRQDEKPSEIELALCYLLVNTQHALRHATLTKRQLAQLYLLLRFSDYDEDKAARMLKRLGLTSFTASILQILSESLALEEGFMPIEPADNRYTNTIRKKLHKINLQ